MRAVREFEIGLMFWATHAPGQDIASVLDFGLRAGQLGIAGDVALDAIEDGWEAALLAHPDFALTTAVCAYTGEDYSDTASVRRTVGLLPPATRRERVERTKTVAKFASRLGIASIGCHIGFVPEQRTDPAYSELCSAVQEVCVCAAQLEQTFALETGQERADALLTFLRDVARPNLKINFDPANLVLYGMGDPVEALRLVGEHVVSVHCKDAVAPDIGAVGQLGTEKRLGEGQVDFPLFLDTLRAVGYRGILSIERETADAALRQADIRHAVAFLRQLTET